MEHTINLTTEELGYLLRMTPWQYDPLAEALLNKLQAASLKTGEQVDPRG